VAIGLHETPARISCKRYRVKPTARQHAVWLYFRFPLSPRDVEEMLEHRGIDVSDETIRAWTVKFGPKIAASLQRHKLPPSSRSHLDEIVCKIGGERGFLWHAVDDEGDVPDLVVEKRRDTPADPELLQQ
jgi:transposase-like protein